MTTNDLLLIKCRRLFIKRNGPPIDELDVGWNLRGVVCEIKDDTRNIKERYKIDKKRIRVMPYIKN